MPYYMMPDRRKGDPCRSVASVLVIDLIFWVASQDTKLGFAQSTVSRCSGGAMVATIVQERSMIVEL